MQSTSDIILTAVIAVAIVGCFWLVFKIDEEMRYGNYRRKKR